MVFKLLKIADISKFAVECDRNSKKPQNVKKKIFIGKLDEFFQKKHEFFKIANDSKNIVDCDWNSKIFQNVHHLFFWKEKNGVLEKKLDFFNTCKCSY